MSDISELAHRIGWAFSDQQLLQQAVTHRSAASENNERLEFLGDAILNFVIAAEIFDRRPDLREGELSRLRASLVNKNALAKIARDIELGPFIVLGGGELKTGGQRRDSILADALEALIGAVYLDGGYQAGQALIQRLYTQHLMDLPNMQAQKDAKTRLQEYLQARQMELPVYTLEETTGRAHAQTFRVTARCMPLDRIGEGVAGNRRQAEQAAAEDLLAKLQYGAEDNE